ncbi:MAG: hypothetical protein J7L92_02665 [Dehalococcoidia bacterium]|nr:hypothetical protein [Dehalococcoidia bacterium]RLC64742.1 MAG: hypothetical protein DRI01_02875 [Chloroflexota bacterium]
MNEELIAPCRMNCDFITSYLAMKNDLKLKGFENMFCAGYYQAVRIIITKGIYAATTSCIINAILMSYAKRNTSTSGWTKST